MADIPTPTPPAPISGYRSRAINAAVAYTTATRPIAGEGVTIADGVGGKTISVEPHGLAQRAAPWLVRAYPVPSSSTSVDWLIRVFGGLAVLDGVQLSPPEQSGIDGPTGLVWYTAPDNDAAAPYLCVKHEEGGWILAWEMSPVGTDEGAEYRAIAKIEDAGPPPRIVQLDLGVVDLGNSAIHYGDVEDASALDSWSVEDNIPTILDIGGDDWRARILIDSRGNIISYNVGDEDTPTPTPPRDAPPCGNPLNVVDDQHPLGGNDNGGGAGGKAEDDDYNPLNYEGDGGFTPTCGGEAA